MGTGATSGSALPLRASSFRGLHAIEHESCEDLESKIFDLPEQKGLTDTNQGP